MRNLKRLVITGLLALACAAFAAVPPGVPEDASLLAAAGGPYLYQIPVINSFNRQADRMNTNDGQVFDGACADWKINYTERGPNLAGPKPDQSKYPRRVIKVAWTRHGALVLLDATKPDDAKLIANGQADAYVWEAKEGLNGSACIDPAGPPPSGNIHVGVKLFGGFYQAAPDDTAAPGTNATAPDGTAVVKTCSLFGCWYVGRQ